MLKQTNIYLFLTIIFIFGCIETKAQEIISSYPLEIDQYPFVDYKKNKIDYEGSSKARYDELFEKLNKLILNGKGKVSVMHIGDSHIQADYFSGEVRKRFNTFPDIPNGGRGFVFPYRVAKTNNPENYRISYTGEWGRCRFVTQYIRCNAGLAGIMVYSYDSVVSIKFQLNTKDYPSYDFNKVKIFYNYMECDYEAVIENDVALIETNYNPIYGFVEYTFDKYLDTLEIKFVKRDTLLTPIEFYGASFENDDPGLVYQSVGVNGANVSTFLKCNLFETQLEVIKPDFVIISLGTNDAYHSRFNVDEYIANLDTLLDRIQNVNPKTAILLTTPGDSYRARRYLNYNMAKAREAIYKVAKEHNAAVWDFYTVMGGLNAISLWYSQGMSQRDKLHFTKKGYHFQGDLLFNAIIKAYGDYIENKTMN